MKLFTLARVLMLLGWLLPAFAQNNASLNGLVTDSSGAGIPQAEITVVNQATNIVNKTTSSAVAEFRVLYLSIGTYTVTCEAPGFSKFERVVRLEAGQSAYLPVVMSIAGAQSTVTVSAEAPLLEATKADRQLVVNNEQVTATPITGRNAIMMAGLVPGATYGGGSQRVFDNGGNAQWTINGGSTNHNTYQLDGAPDNGFTNMNMAAYMPTSDVAEEVKVITNVYDAEYGQTGGGIVSFSLKSGTNDLHGSAYEFMKRTPMQANSFSNNAAGIARSPNNVNQYGFVATGPIWLPKLYNGRNRSFFMVNLERYRDGIPQIVNSSVPAPEFLTGDFSKLVDTQNRQIVIYDPATTAQDASGAWVRSAFPGNQIPSDRLSPVAQKILSHYAAPTRSAAPGSNYSSGNYYGSPTYSDPYESLAFKIDHNVSDRHRFFYRHVNSTFCQHTYNGSNGTDLAPGEAVRFLNRNNEADAFNWTSTLSPSAIFNFRASYNRFHQYYSVPENYGFDLSTLGFSATTIKQLPMPDFFGTYALSGYNTLGGNGSDNISNTYAVQPQLTVIRGSHTLKAGADIRFLQWTSFSPNTWGMSATASLTQSNYLQSDALSGNSVASFLLGGASASATYNAQPYVSIPYYGLYLQDDWRITRRLTLNLGLRNDIYVGPTERYNRMNAGFDSTATNPVSSLIDRTQFASVPTLVGGLRFAGVNGVRRSPYATSAANLQPRAGAAYQVSSKLVIRGGWGRNFINPDYSSEVQTLGFSGSTSYSSSLDGGMTITPGFFANPFPTGVNAPAGAGNGLSTYLGQGFSYAYSDFKPSHIDQFSAGAEILLPLSSVLDVSYVGSRSANLYSVYPSNQPSLSVRQRCNWAEGGNPTWCNTNVANPFQGLAAFTGSSMNTATTLTNYQLAQPYPQFGTLNEVGRNDDRMWFNSAQVQWRTRMRKHLTANINYTFSKQMMTGYNANYLTSGSDFLDVQNKTLARGVYEGDQTHRFRASLVYDLPFGKGQRFVNASGGLVNRLVGGWQVSPLFTWSSGVPWALPSNVFLVGDQHVSNIDWSAQTVVGMKRCVAQWNTDGSIAMLASSTAAGCSTYNWLIQPQYAPRAMQYLDSKLRLHTTPNLDLSIVKQTPITERLGLQFRVEAYNAANTQNSAGNSFSNSPTATTFGTLVRTSGAVGARVVQLAAKLVW